MTSGEDPIRLPQPPDGGGYGRFERAAPAPFVRQPDQTLAKVALWLSFVPLGATFLAGLGLGIAVLVRSRKDGLDHGRRKAIGAIVVASTYVVLIVVIAVLASRYDVDRDDDGEVVDTGEVAVTDLRTGDCIEEPIAGGEQVTLTVTPCDDPHRAEIFFEFDLEGGSYPGRRATARLARGGCLAQLPAAVRDGPPGQDLELYYLYPNNERNFRGDRTVSCLVVSEGLRTGSVTELA
ncbi:hypothetical protein [Nocardioides sp.]|uniref:hypothetical protein n=1 Tax=Nocardioides sp. TaxID=35761 RepID=UPI002721C04C|nr:hypothetical protein [Nocardioides sp.]MDO9458341.1 hypothetical protein [Nocardioides sp.]